MGSAPPQPVLTERFPGDADLRSGARAMVGGDLVGEVCGIVVDEAEQGRAAGVLPGQPRTYRPGILVTPRRCTTRPCFIAAGMRIQVWSER